MKSTVFVLLFAIFTFNSIIYAQNIELEKVLDRDVSLYNHSNAEGPYFKYEKFQGDKLVRFQDNRIQLFDNQFNLIWKITLDKLKGPDGKDNYYYINVTDDFIYVLQRNSAAYAGKTKVILHKIDVNGEKISLDLTGKISLEKAIKLHIMDGKIILELYEQMPDKLGWKPKLTIVTINEEMTAVENSIELPVNREALENKLHWHFSKISDKTIFYKAVYQKMADENSDKKLVYERVMKLSSNLEILDDTETEITGVNYVPVIEPNYFREPHFDTTRVNVYVPWGGPIQSYWHISRDRQIKNILVSKGTGDYENIVVPFFQLILGKTEVSNYTVALFDVIHDPINNSFNMMLREGSRAFLLIFNDDFEVAAVRKFKIGYTLYSGRPDNSNFAFPFAKDGKELIGALPEGHKINAFEYSLTLKDKAFYTIINYDDYQLLISDNGASGVSKLYKIVR